MRLGGFRPCHPERRSRFGKRSTRVEGSGFGRSRLQSCTSSSRNAVLAAGVRCFIPTSIRHRLRGDTFVQAFTLVVRRELCDLRYAQWRDQRS